MRNWLAKFTPESWVLRKFLMGAVLIGACAGAFCYGRKQNVTAQTPTNSDPYGLKVMANGALADYDRRIVAYLGQNIPVTRAELGEYLIARFGAERLEFLVNRKIVEMECQKHHILATDAEVEERFRRDLNSFGKIPLTEKDFVNNVLRRFNKTLYEWKEDVIRPKIMMEKLVKSQVTVTEKDVQEGFEARFGPKVKCRMIVLEKGNSALVHQVWQYARQGPTQFLEKAKTQFIPNLAEKFGEVPPIHKHFGDKLIEDAAFRLRENEVSESLLMQDGTSVILLCEKRLPADASVKYETVRMQIFREVEELKIAQKIPETFAELRRRASPRLMLDGAISHVARVETQSPMSSFVEHAPLRPQPIGNVPPPQPTELVPPTGLVPARTPNTPLPAPTGLSGVTLPKIDPPK